MATVGYARVSTSDQSLEVQIGQLQEVGCDLIFSEIISGSRTDRPELIALMNYVRDGDCVICTKMDRIARSTAHLLDLVETFKRQNISFRVLNISFDTDTPTGKLMLTMLAGVAQFERELMLERQRDGIEKAKIAGKYKGRKPTAREKTDQIIALVSQGKKKADIAKELEIGLSSVYRIVAANSDKMDMSESS